MPGTLCIPQATCESPDAAVQAKMGQCEYPMTISVCSDLVRPITKFSSPKHFSVGQDIGLVLL